MAYIYWNKKVEGFGIAVFGKDNCFMACCLGLDELLNDITGKILPPDWLKKMYHLTFSQKPDMHSNYVVQKSSRLSVAKNSGSGNARFVV